MISRYQKKISGPILDRIDLHVEVPRIKFEKLAQTNNAEKSADIRERAEKARAIQQKRFSGSKTVSNSEMDGEQIKQFCQLDADCANLMRSAVSTFHLSGRAYYRIIKVARTIADLAGEERIAPSHIAEAIQYRFKAE